MLLADSLKHKRNGTKDSYITELYKLLLSLISLSSTASYGCNENTGPPENNNEEFKPVMQFLCIFCSTKGSSV